ncbi:MAG: oxidoreductase [Rhodobacteraceae bacterium]|nr:oxidoreductase [Paracoccaceae bacterium]
MKPWKSVLAAALFALLPVISGATDPGSDAPILLEVEVQSIAGQQAEVTLFRLADLKALPVVRFETNTIWTQGVQRFTGVSLAALTRHLGITDGTLVLQAVNDYIVKFPVSGAVEGGPIIAYEHNDAPMSRRNKGPLWIVFPYDSDRDYQTAEIFAMSVWQLIRITVEPVNQ